MLSKVISATLVGVDARPVEVETELSPGLPKFNLIGLGDAAIKEARYRIQSALRSNDISLPTKSVTINLAPAALRKDGASLDLPMALSLLVACGFIRARSLEQTMVIGELALSGDIRPVRGIIAVASLARARGMRRMIVPEANGSEAGSVADLEVLAAPTLEALLRHLLEEFQLPPPVLETRADRFREDIDFSEVRGQHMARRAAEVAAAGQHNLLLVGNPGSGKTMIARRLATILPAMTQEEQLEITKVWSAAGLTMGLGGLIPARPFRCPHHSITEAGLIGGGSRIRPGEVSLAHRGVLFLDEAPELPRRVLESMRQPLEDREVSLSRANGVVRLPAAFMLVAAANPCPCGWLGHDSDRCWCGPRDIERYAGRISGALLDRIDIIVDVPSLDTESLVDDANAESSEVIRRRVEAARGRAMTRAGKPNGELAGRSLRRWLRMETQARKTLKKAVEEVHFSARGLDRLLRVARTIADLRGAENVEKGDVLEAVRFRCPQYLKASERAA